MDANHDWDMHSFAQRSPGSRRARWACEETTRLPPSLSWDQVRKRVEIRGQAFSSARNVRDQCRNRHDSTIQPEQSLRARQRPPLPWTPGKGAVGSMKGALKGGQQKHKQSSADLSSPLPQGRRRRVCPRTAAASLAALRRRPASSALGLFDLFTQDWSYAEGSETNPLILVVLSQFTWYCFPSKVFVVSSPCFGITSFHFPSFLRGLLA
jgi:hypothetical protein